MKATMIFGLLMLASGILVLVCAVINLSGMVAIFTGVVGIQGGGGPSAVALLFGLVALGIFAFAYKRAMWNWIIRGGLIATGLIIFISSIAGLTENWNLQGGSSQGFAWRSGGVVIRTIEEAFLWVDFDVVLFLMLLGSIGILAAAIWGAFGWEKAKTSERAQDQLQSVINELPPTAFSPEANLRFELEQHFQSSPNPTSAPSQSPPNPQPSPGATSPGTGSAPLAPPGPAQGTTPSTPGFGGRGRRCPSCYQRVSLGAQICPHCGAGS